MKEVTDEIGRTPKRQPYRIRRTEPHRNARVLCWADFAYDVEFVAGHFAVRMHRFDPTTTDCGPLVAYCEGHMPAYAFADWLEEQVSDFPPEGLAILRERAEGE